MRSPTLATLENRYSVSDKCSPNSFRWPNVFLMQLCDLCCCHSAGLIGMRGRWWVADGDWGSGVGRWWLGLIRVAEASSRLIKSILTELTERAASLEVQNKPGCPDGDEWMSPACSALRWKAQYRLTSKAICISDTTRRQVHFSLVYASVLMLLIVCVCVGGGYFFFFFRDLLCSHYAAMHHQIRVISHSTTAHFFSLRCKWEKLHLNSCIWIWM